MPFGFTFQPKSAQTGPAVSGYKPSGWEVFDRVLGGSTISEARRDLFSEEAARRAEAQKQEIMRGIVGQLFGSDATAAPNMAGGPVPMPNMADAPAPGGYRGMGPGMDGEPVGPAPMPSPNLPAQTQRRPVSLPTLREAAPYLMAGEIAGLPLNGVRDLLEKTGPDVEFVNGLGVDKRDPRSVGRYIPSLDKGQEPLFDSNGRIVAIRNMDGSVAAASEMARAVTAAQEGAKAGFTIRETPLQGGGAVVETQEQALRNLGANLPGLPGSSGPPAVGARPPGYGIRPSKAQEARDVGMAGLEVESAKRQQEATFDLPKLEDQANTALGVLDKLEKHPMLRNRTCNTAIFPPVGPQAVDFEALRDQATGGAFLEAIAALKGSGQITEIEGTKGTAAITRLQNPRLSEQGFIEALNDYRAVINAGLERARRAAGQAVAPSAPPSKSQLRAGQVYQTPRGPMLWTGSGFIPQ